MDDVNLNNILPRYRSAFDKELETLKNVEVTMKIKSDALPKFCRARERMLLKEYSNLFLILNGLPQYPQ